MPRTELPPPANVELLQRLLLEAVEQHQAQPASDGGAPAPKRTTFYTFADKGGSQNIVDTFERIPQAYRTQAREWMLSPATTADAGVQQARARFGEWHGPSLLLGAGIAAFGFLALLLLKRLRWLLWLGLLVAGVSSVGGAYWLGLRPTTAGARALMDRARTAVQQLRQASDQHDQSAEPERPR